MSTIDVSTIKTEILAVKRNSLEQMNNPRAHAASIGEAFHRGVESRRNATSLVAPVSPPFTPTVIGIDTPFLIWALRDWGTRASDLEVDYHYEPMKSSARAIKFLDVHGDALMGEEEVGFYFLWQNDLGIDVVVDVSSELDVSGVLDVNAYSGLLITPFWDVGTEGSIDASVDVNLSVFEWWNQPITQPLWQPDQQRAVGSLSVDGGWELIHIDGEGALQVIAGAYPVSYESFFVPRDGAAVFEVSLRMAWGGWDSRVEFDFYRNPGVILCPSLQLELSSSPETMSAAID